MPSYEKMNLVTADCFRMVIGFQIIGREKSKIFKINLWLQRKPSGEAGSISHFDWSKRGERAGKSLRRNCNLRVARFIGSARIPALAAKIPPIAPRLEILSIINLINLIF